MTTETCRYRGYNIVPNRQWSQWCVSVYTTRADLPLFSRSTLRTLALRKEEAVAEAKQCIDPTAPVLDSPNVRSGGLRPHNPQLTPIEIPPFLK